ncbi:MAG: HAD hydrolase-like protein [Methanomassiliicoccaceae archaeon]|nr:HAD hydrolase-like protein [Methanomassiliicoccaceae archaeon]
MMSAYEAVIFDLDGTLIDSSEGIILAAEETLEALGYPSIERDELRSYIGPPIGEAITRRNGLGSDDLKRFNDVFRGIYKNKYLMRANVYPGVMDMLSGLRGIISVGIATNKREDMTKLLLDDLGISPLCDAAVGLDLEGKLKKKDIVEKCVSALGTADRKRIVMAGDTRNDAEAAKECGISFIGVTYGFGFRDRSEITYGSAADDVQSLRDLLLI